MNGFSFRKWRCMLFGREANSTSFGYIEWVNEHQWYCRMWSELNLMIIYLITFICYICQSSVYWSPIRRFSQIVPHIKHTHTKTYRLLGKNKKALHIIVLFLIHSCTHSAKVNSYWSIDSRFVRKVNCVDDTKAKYSYLKSVLFIRSN